jgi:hypothetical protein
MLKSSKPQRNGDDDHRDQYEQPYHNHEKCVVHLSPLTILASSLRRPLVGLRRSRICWSHLLCWSRLRPNTGLPETSIYPNALEPTLRFGVSWRHGGFENRVVPPFVVGNAHTVFEWCMIYTDRHPAGLHPNHNGAS